MRDIFGIRFPRLKPPVQDGDNPPQLHGAPSKRNARKQLLLLVSGFVALFFVAAIQQGDPATGRVSTTTLLAVLKDPLTLFAERSPGGRAEGALLPVKPGGPQERVLSTIRERDPTGTLPGVGDPVVAGVPEAPGPGGVGPEESALPGSGGGLPGGGGAPGGGFGRPGGFAPFAAGPGGLIPENFAAAPPGDGGPGPGDPGIDDPGIGGPGPTAPPPPGIFDPVGGAPVPEPATWAMMILGFFAIGTAIRRKRSALPCAR